MFALFFTGASKQGGATSDDDEAGGDVNTTCAEEEASGHDFAQCGGFVIFRQFLHRSLSLFAFLPLPPLPPGFESELLCEKLHLSPRAQVPLGVMFTWDRCAVRTCAITFGTLSRSSRAVAETRVCVHHRPAGSFASNGRVQLSWIAWRKQVCDFVYVVGVSDTIRDRLQRLRHCFFGWRTSRRLQLLEVCEPLSRRKQQLRFVSAGNRPGNPLVKCCRVLCRARKDFLVQHSQDRAA